MTGDQGSLDFGTAFREGENLAKELTRIATSSDLGDIREDATAEAMAQHIGKVPSGMLGVSFAHTVKMLTIGLSVYADLASGRDPLNPTGV